MKRRRFLQVPVVALPLGWDGRGLRLNRPKKGFKVEAGQDRFSNPLRPYLFLKVSGKDTDGDLCVFETIEKGGKPGGPPLHIHPQQDEWFYVIEGEMKVKIGEEIFHLKAGDSVFAPRGVPHAPYNVGGDSKGLILFQPAGSMEAFFEEFGQLKSFPPPLEEAKALFQKHGMTIVGPPPFLSR